jgi:hypothetical protein
MAVARDALDHALPGGALNDALGVLVAESAAEVAGGVASVQWAEEEIGAAIRRHPGAASDLWHSFPLLGLTIACTGWGTEFVIRGHARERGRRRSRHPAGNRRRVRSGDGRGVREDPAACRSGRVLLPHVAAGVPRPVRLA